MSSTQPKPAKRVDSTGIIPAGKRAFVCTQKDHPNYQPETLYLASPEAAQGVIDHGQGRWATDAEIADYVAAHTHEADAEA